MRKRISRKWTKLIKASYFFLILSLISCNKTFESKLIDNIESACSISNSTMNCVVDLDTVTDFDWDSLYVFGGLMTKNEIDNVLGFKCDCSPIPDNYIRWIFTKGRVVIYEYEYYGLDGKIQFRPLGINQTIKFSKQQSKFRVYKKRKDFNNTFFYDLYPILRDS